MVRPGTADDAQAVARIHVDAWRAAYAHALPADGLASLSVEQRAELHRRVPPLVAERDGEIVGFVGVGQSGEERLRELGYREAILWVLEDNPRAHRFYRAAGWRADGTSRPIEIFGVAIPEVRFRKTL